MGDKKRYALAFDIGGSKLVSGIVDSGGAVAATEYYYWSSLTEAEVLGAVIRSGQKLLSAFGGPVECVGAAIPGLADPETGVWIESCFSGIRDIPVADILKKEFKTGVYIDNDVNMCAVGEKMFGACADCGNFAWLTVSNGCGGAVYINGNIYRGAFGNAGEFGHITVEEDEGLLCGCGNKGCLEAQASGRGIYNRYRGSNKNGPANDAAEIAESARSGDRAAIEIYEKEGVYLGRAIAAIINTLNPETVIIGGGVSQSFDLFEKSMTETVRRRIYLKANPSVQIRRTELGYFAPLIGAGAAAMENFK